MHSEQTPDLLICSGPCYIFSIRTVVSTDCGQVFNILSYHTFCKFYIENIQNLLHYIPWYYLGPCCHLFFMQPIYVSTQQAKKLYHTFYWSFPMAFYPTNSKSFLWPKKPTLLNKCPHFSDLISYCPYCPHSLTIELSLMLPEVFILALPMEQITLKYVSLKLAVYWHGLLAQTLAKGQDLLKSWVRCKPRLQYLKVRTIFQALVWLAAVQGSMKRYRLKAFTAQLLTGFPKNKQSKKKGKICMHIYDVALEVIHQTSWILWP